MVVSPRTVEGGIKVRRIRSWRCGVDARAVRRSCHQAHKRHVQQVRFMSCNRPPAESQSNRPGGRSDRRTRLSGCSAPGMAIGWHSCPTKRPAQSVAILHEQPEPSERPVCRDGREEEDLQRRAGGAAGSRSFDLTDTVLSKPDHLKQASLSE
ncbi:hypothetical protein AAT19DRAFT_14099 [Rhodotorula toruloides]|uniref:Uncharacterized protein n=1 Tax=Rhodotorula toruloides TaxID=5286 RepID=A0A2T0AAQ0_RHOTO|nr:hypothetical protein AAT19DRAFT_14099 [Rhodotorula toruloides]